MNSLLVHGCFDRETAGILKQLGVKEIVFDLRGKSLNLITYEELKNILLILKEHKLYLKFQDESETMIRSYLDLLKDYQIQFTLIFTGVPKEVDERFYWFYSKELDYKAILNKKNILGVILPIKEKESFKSDHEFWELVDQKKLDVYLHGEEDELETYFGTEGMKLSFDLDSGSEEGYRKVDMDSMQKKKIWRILNENIAF